MKENRISFGILQDKYIYIFVYLLFIIIIFLTLESSKLNKIFNNHMLKLLPVLAYCTHSLNFAKWGQSHLWHELALFSHYFNDFLIFYLFIIFLIFN